MEPFALTFGGEKYNLLLKREDQNITGSHKIRGVGEQIRLHMADGYGNFTISSSGNSAIAAVYVVNKLNQTLGENEQVRLDVFVSPKLSQHKLHRLLQALTSEKIGEDEIEGDAHEVKNEQAVSDQETYDKQTGEMSREQFNEIHENEVYEQLQTKESVALTPQITLHVSQHAKRDAAQFAIKNEAVFLRGSTDKYGTQGYESLGEEIILQVNARYNTQIDPPDAPSKNTFSKMAPPAIFFPVSSGTTVKGVYDGMMGMREQNKISAIPKFHIVQTTKVHPIAKAVNPDIDYDGLATQTSLADSIVDRVAHRKDEIVDIVRRTNGNAWVVDDGEIMDAVTLLRLGTGKFGFSGESAMTLAGFIQAVKHDPDPAQWENTVLVLTGEGVL